MMLVNKTFNPDIRVRFIRHSGTECLTLELVLICSQRKEQRGPHDEVERLEIEESASNEHRNFDARNRSTDSCHEHECIEAK